MPRYKEFRRRRPAYASQREFVPQSGSFTPEEKEAFGVLLDEMGNRVVDAMSLNPEKPVTEIIPEVREELLTWLDSPLTTYASSKA